MLAHNEEGIEEQRRLTACLHPQSLPTPWARAGSATATRYLQMGIDADGCPGLLWVPGWMAPQALELGRIPLQGSMPFCAALLAAGKGPRNPPGY